MDYVQILKNNINLNVMTNSLPKKGNLVYEYNPFRNYRLLENKYFYKGEYYTEKELSETFNIKIDRNTDDGDGRDNPHYLKQWLGVPSNETAPILYEKGQLVDFITDELHFSLEHPVHMVAQLSYDGSVNLIINDGLNIPRLINSRFSATGRNTYEIIDRKGNNDTNIYDEGDQFDIDTSLYKRVSKIPKLLFRGVQAGGNLKVGNYHFYFKYSDADGNETDFIAESGLVSVFIGFDSPRSITSGTKNENSTKQVKFQLSNIDDSYDYVSVYYSRSTAEGNETSFTEYLKIDKKYVVNNALIANVVITGFENTVNITAADINLLYNLVNAVQTSAVCLNMLFLGNVHKPDIPYNELQELSLRFLPYLKEVTYTLDIDLNYNISSTNKGYYDPEFIYSNTGYWGNELYRFGIVYILPNNELSPVFNIRGRESVGVFDSSKQFISEELYKNINDGQYNHYKLFNKDKDIIKIPIKEENGYVLNPEENEGIIAEHKASFENSKGVVSFNPKLDTDKIYALDIRVSDDVILELRKYVKGYFFVRLKRIPTILALGITIGVDNSSNTPTIPTCNGFLNDLQNNLDSSYVETKDINDINYISEGFLSRYLFRLKKKKSSLWSKIGMVFASVAIVTAVALGSIATFGGVAVSAVTLSTSLSFTAFAVSGTAITAGIAGAVAAGVVAVAGAVDETIKAVLRSSASKELKGRYTEIPKGYERAEKDDSRNVGGSFIDRVIIKDSSHNQIRAILCPDYEINQPYYNNIFTGNEHIVRTTKTLGFNILTGYNNNYFNNKDRHFYMPSYYDTKDLKLYLCKICGVPEDTKVIGLDDLKYRSRAGDAEEAFRFEQVGLEYESSEDLKVNSDLIRGSFGAYVAIDNYPNNPAETVEILVPGYNSANMDEYIQLRSYDKSPYYAISDRISLNDLNDYLINPLSAIVMNLTTTCGYQYELYRGDCYICLFTHRVIRNFNDPSAPYNDKIVDKSTWKNNYDPDNTEKYADINLGDVNAVLLGMWVTFKVRSSNNLNIRTLDKANVDEVAMSGHPRGYYPYLPMSIEGSYKIPESEIFNKGFATSVSERWNLELPDVPYIKNWFGTRIMYSDIHVNDAFKNGFRVFLGTNYRDYTREYGEIVKLISLESNLLCVFEHGVALIPVNERAVAGQSAGGNVYINTSNVLPENPKIISDMYGSQWADSVLKVPGKSGNSRLYVYGVDTVAKKIWRTDGNTLECISDFRVQEFLNNNITLGERELTPKIGIRNVKTVYNAFKLDVMFTFYDNTYGFEEKAWNLCWNELLQKFITFYSWVPSYMENINNMPFSFDRNVSKWIAKLGVSHTKSSIASGITLSNVIISDSYRKGGAATDNLQVDIKYLTKDGTYKTVKGTVINENKYIGMLSLDDRMLPDGLTHYEIDYELMPDGWGNYKQFEIAPMDCTYNGKTTIGGFKLPDDAMYPKRIIPLRCLRFATSDDEYFPIYYTDKDGVFEEVTDYNTDLIYTFKELYKPESLYSELYYRNKAYHVYADDEINKVGTKEITKDYVPINLNDKFTEADIDWIANTLSITKAEAKNFVGRSKSWLEDEQMLTLFEHLYPEDTIIGNASTEFKGSNPPPKTHPCTTVGKFRNEVTDIQNGGSAEIHNIRFDQHWVSQLAEKQSNKKVWYELPIYKDLSGKRPTLPREEQLNPDKLVTLLNIKAKISIITSNDTSQNDVYKDMASSYYEKNSVVDAGYYESTIALAPEWNMQFLTSDFWKHGLAGLIDIADEIFPTYWYGRQHPFEFECVVVNDPSVHKIFTNLEIVANKAKPESFHYEVIGETYDFAKDKPNMYFRQEAMKALWLYNGADITYNRNFLKVQTRQLAKSADFIHRYYTREDTINDIEDYYISVTYPKGMDYRHLSGGEIVYYPNRQEFRIWNHAKAVDIDDLSLDDTRSIIAANCQYLEDRWKVTINPILVCYKNEYSRKYQGPLIQPLNSTWAKGYNSSRVLPSLPIYNSPIPDLVLKLGTINFPENDLGKQNALYNLYDLSEYNPGGGWKPLDTTNWLNDVGIYQYNFGQALNRKEVDIRDKFVKVRIRYTGEELAVIDFLNTIYRISYA